MSIIEREIEKRQAIIDGKDAKIADLADLRARAEALEVEIAGIDTEFLAAEIAELRTYLPVPETTEIVE